jgi:hypothetical protein
MPFGQTAHESVLDEIVDLSFIAHQCSGIAPEAGDFSFNALGKIIHPAFSNSFDRCIDRSDGVKASERHAKAIDHIITIRESA